MTTKIVGNSRCGCRLLSNICNKIMNYCSKHYMFLTIVGIFIFYFYTLTCRHDTIRLQWPTELTEDIDYEDLKLGSQYRIERSVLDKVRTITRCLDRPLMPSTQRRGEYWVLYNYVRANRSHSCYETITYTTHGDYSFLDNLVPLLKRWKGPISIALHAPGTDFHVTMDSIDYLRDCTIPEVRDLVTFHIYFHENRLPTKFPSNGRMPKLYNCSRAPPYQSVSKQQMYKTKKKLLYPINVGRNIARETAQTHFLLPSDIELYPSANIIPKFLSMIAENEGPLLSQHPRVFPLRIFEVTSNSDVPDNKQDLLKMLRNETAVSFHYKMCPYCHRFPMTAEWEQQDESEDGRLHVFHVGKRKEKYTRWEPIFIGTHADPLYDERLSWEGKSDKMSQGYAFCVLDYDFLILDNAFLVHKPGIKVYRWNKERNAVVWKTNKKVKPIIFSEMKILFGSREGCSL